MTYLSLPCVGHHKAARRAQRDASLECLLYTPAKKHKLPPACEANKIKPGEVRNSLGRPPGTKNLRSNLLSKLGQVWAAF